MLLESLNQVLDSEVCLEDIGKSGSFRSAGPRLDKR